MTMVDVTSSKVGVSVNGKRYDVLEVRKYDLLGDKALMVWYEYDSRTFANLSNVETYIKSGGSKRISLGW